MAIRRASAIEEEASLAGQPDVRGASLAQAAVISWTDRRI
jgi:hypothetical protein